MLIRDAIALACGGSARLTKGDRKRLVDIAEHVLLRAVLAPEQPEQEVLTRATVLKPLAVHVCGDATESFAVSKEAGLELLEYVRTLEQKLGGQPTN